MSLGRPYAPGLPWQMREQLEVVELSSGVFCWIWQGQRSADGYGVVRLADGNRWAHVVAFRSAYGPVPRDPGAPERPKLVGHVCHDLDETCEGGPWDLHRACCNPAHLRAMTAAENVRAGRAGRSR